MSDRTFHLASAERVSTDRAWVRDCARSLPLSKAPSHMPLHISTATTVNELSALSEDWLGLVERSKCSVPYQLPEWLITWWQWFRQDTALIRDSLRVQVVRTDSGRLVGVVPLMLTERPRFGPLRVGALSFLGADPYITELRSPILDPAYEGEVASALATHLREQGGWDWVSWTGLMRDSEFATVLGRAMDLRWGTVETGNVLVLAPTWEEFKAGLKRNIKESLRHCYNGLKRDGLSTRLVVAETAADIDDALGAFFRLHAMRARQEGTLQHPNRFAGARKQRFLRAVSARLAERRVARVFTLYVGDALVAVRMGFVLPDCLYLYYSGFDPAWSRYSVMTTTVAETIKYAIGLGLPRLHLSMGVDVSKARWGPTLSEYHEAVSVRPTPTARAAFKVYSWSRNNTDSLRRSLGRVVPERRFD